MLRTVLICILGSAVVAGCGGREARPVNTVQVYDTALSCEMLIAEIQSNTTKISQLSKEESDAGSANIAVGVVGVVLFWPALFALDTSNAEEVEMNAHRQRINYLQSVYAQKCVEPQQEQLKQATLVK